MTESPILRDILCAVTAMPRAMFWRANVGMAVTQGGRVVKFNVKGTPDIIGCYRGRAVGIETKSTTGRQRVEQRNFQTAWEKADGIYILANSLDVALKSLAAIP